MAVSPTDKVRECLARAAEFRKRARLAANPAAKAELRRFELHWLDIAESYRFVDSAGRFLDHAQWRALATQQEVARKAAGVGLPPTRIAAATATNGTSLADLLEVLVRASVEYADGKARAAFYLADTAACELHHITAASIISSHKSLAR